MYTGSYQPDALREQEVKQVEGHANTNGTCEDKAATGAFDLQPVLTGAMLTLRPLHADDFASLFAAAADPLIWEQRPVPTRYEHAVFAEFFAGAMASGGALLVLDNATGAVVGSSRYYDWDPAR